MSSSPTGTRKSGEGERKKMANMRNRGLPEEMLVEILSRVPVKCLLRFKCVCKSWYALSTNPHFITKHLACTTSHNHNHRAILKGWGWDQWVALGHLQPHVSTLSNDTLELSGDVDLTQLFQDEVVRLLVVGLCNGILCFAGTLRKNPKLYGGDYDHVVLWNPATRESKMLPQMDMPTSTSTCTSNFGFGIDPKTNDYKVVRIMSFDSHCEVVVYSLSTNSWRVIDSSPSPSYSIDLPFHPSYLNGVHYWWACEKEDEVEEIPDNRFLISFDMSNEVFQEVLRPPAVGYVYGDIAVINDSVTLILTYMCDVKKWFEIWVLNESGVERTWTKIFTIEDIFHRWDLIQLREDGLVVLRTHEACSLVLYDPETQELRDLRISEPDCQLVTYTETLVSLNGPGNLVEQQDNS
jgi:F-box interacting protein